MVQKYWKAEINLKDPLEEALVGGFNVSYFFTIFLVIGYKEMLKVNTERCRTETNFEMHYIRKDTEMRL